MAENLFSYRQNGDYLIPDIQLEIQEQRPLGKYGRMRKDFLQKNRPILYAHLVMTGKLFPHLWEFQKTAERNVERAMGELEKKKKTDLPARTGRADELRVQAEKEILAELISS